MSATAVYDPDHRQLVFLGLVQGAAGPREETWVWDDVWRQLHPLHEPAPPRATLLMYDPATHQVLLDGGSYEPPQATFSPTSCGAATCFPVSVDPVQFFADPWVWTGADWTALPATAVSDRASPLSAVFSSARAELIAEFGGILGGAYAWDGRAWTLLSRSVPFDGFSLTLDASNGQAIGFKGREGGCFESCELPVSRTIAGDGVTWTSISGRQPESAAGNLVSDPVDGGVLLLNERGHTWVLAHGGWWRAASSGPPRVPGFLYSDGSGVFYQPEPGVPCPRWSWDGKRWTPSGKRH